jgi:hypothetical protein
MSRYIDLPAEFQPMQQPSFLVLPGFVALFQLARLQGGLFLVLVVKVVVGLEHIVHHVQQGLSLLCQWIHAVVLSDITEVIDRHVHVGSGP